MEPTDIKLEKLQTIIRNQQPELSDAEKLTDSIMHNVRKLPHREKNTKTIVWFRIISGAAAIFLLGLFVTQSNDTNVMASNSKPALLHFTKTEIDSSCFQNKKFSQRALLESYACYLQKNAIENNRFKNIKQTSEN